MSKEERTKRAEFTCDHYKNGFEHPNCFRKKLHLKNKEVIGFLDIETTNLRADFAYVLSYCIKTQNGKLYKGLITQQDIFSGRYDKRILKQLLKDIQHFDRVVTHYGCLTTGHKVLTADLRYIPVEKLCVGDKLFAFEETSTTGVRKWIESEVVSNSPIRAKVFELQLSDGTTLTATGKHPFLVRTNNSGYRWSTVESLYKCFNSKKHCGGIQFRRTLPVWDYKDTYESGYLSGFFDSEGNLSQVPRKVGWGKYNLSIKATQNNNKVLETAKLFLSKNNIPYTVGNYDRNNRRIFYIQITGGLSQALRFLGLIRPKRLLPNFNIRKLGSIKTKFPDKTKITNIVKKGIHTVWALGTTSETYVSEGFLSHNTRFDIPFLRSRCLFWKLQFPIFKELKHTDTYFIAKAKLLLRSRKLGVICEFLGIPAKNHPLRSDIWFKCQYGNKKALQYVLTHNEEDVISLQRVWNRLSKYVGRNNTSV